MVVPVRFEHRDVILEAIRVIGRVHSLEILRRMNESIRSRLIHGQVRLDMLRIHLAGLRLMRSVRTRVRCLPERKEAPVRVRTIGRVCNEDVSIWLRKFSASRNLPSGAEVWLPQIRSPPFIHMLADPGHFLKRLALSFREKNFSSAQEPAGCCNNDDEYKCSVMDSCMPHEIGRITHLAYPP